MPSKSAVVRAAAPAAASSALPVLVGLGALILLPTLIKGIKFGVGIPGDIAEGTGDFFSGVFGGAAVEEDPITTARTAELPDVLIQLVPPLNRDPDAPLAVFGTPATYDPTEVTSVIVQYDESGAPMLFIDNASPAVPIPDFFQVTYPSLAQEVGAALIYDPITGLYTDPLLDIGGFTLPSAQDVVGGFNEIFGGIF
jgi:hypothetical protein